MNKLLQVTSLTIMFGLVVAACAPLAPGGGAGGNPSPGPAQMTTRPAPVERVEVQILQNSPVQINALVRGHLTESCATLGPSQVTYAANVFQIAIVAVSPNDRGCLQVVTPFETTIALDTRNLPAGTYTAMANGVSAVFTLPSANAAPTAAPTQSPTAAPTQSPTAAPTQSPTAAPTQSPTAVPTHAGCTDAATFVSDVTIPDHTVLAPGTAFIKTWKLKNSGSCTWSSSYLVSWISGTTMSQQPGYWILQKGQTVMPGQNVNVSVGMTAPSQKGNYASYWGLRQENGSLMPIAGGANGNSFYVKIKVDDGSNPPAGTITNASIDIELEQGSGAICTADSTYFVHAYITADGPTTANYEIDSSAGQISAGYFETLGTSGSSPSVTGTVTFNRADTKTISLRFVGPYPYPADITMLLRVNGGQWHNAKVMCP